MAKEKPVKPSTTEEWSAPETKSYYIGLMKANAPEIIGPLTEGQYTLIPRREETRYFDLAVLSARHGLDLAPDLFSFLVGWCALECRIEAASLKEAKEKANLFKAMLLMRGHSPFTMPFISTHSLNDWAGIGARDAGIFPEDLSAHLKEGITSDSSRVEAWSFDLNLQTTTRESVVFTVEDLMFAADYAPVWEDLARNNAGLRAAQATLVTAASIPDYGQSLLHVWTGVEALFPTVEHELAFKISLYLAQIYLGSSPTRHDFFKRAKRAYGKRSTAAHGSPGAITQEDWNETWLLFTAVCRSILVRGKLPTEVELQEELFSTQAALAMSPADLPGSS